MSATLTWYTAGPQTKTGTAVGNCFTDLKSLIDAQSGNSDFAWEVASSNLGSTPYQVTLKRKDGSVGRILVICWTSAPAGNNSAILDTAPTTNNLYICWFPSGNVDTPSNLTASSGTVMGNDSNCVKCNYIGTLSSIYGTNYTWAAVSCDEALVLFTNNNSASITAFWFAGAGDIVVDAADNAYGATFGAGSSGASICYFLMNSGASAAWSTGTQNAGATPTSTLVRTNYGVTNSAWGFPLVAASSALTSQANFAANDPLTNSSTQYAYFIAIPLAAYGGYAVKGIPLKLRQIAMGPLVSGLWPVWNTTGPVVKARGAQQYNVNSQGLWFTNFKI